MSVSQPARNLARPIDVETSWFESPPTGSQSDDIAHVVLTAEHIAARARELGDAISRDYWQATRNGPLLAIVTLRGAITFAADLVRSIDLPVEMDFIAASSYGAATTSSGSVRILKDLETELEGRHAILIEDIIDSGLTLSELITTLNTRRPASLRVCALLDKNKPSPIRDEPGRLAYTGFAIPDEFVVGYGLDYDQRYRNLPYIGVLKPEVYTRAEREAEGD
ncbi:MAG TPA: hypoxanthine phosphoribosyltransferase [Ktedonobacterales bacterium]|nr:hypoxanthine phosphoribosyltransferase [Ktedonobacterales bacterium]